MEDKLEDCPEKKKKTLLDKCCTAIQALADAPDNPGKLTAAKNACPEDPSCCDEPSAASDPCGTASPSLTLNARRCRYRRIRVNLNRTGGGPPDWQEIQVIASARFLAKNDGVKGNFVGGTAPNISARQWVQNEVGFPTDDAGHVIGEQFGGRGIIANVFPQQSDANQVVQRTRENRIMAKIKDSSTCRVCIHVLFDYDPENARLTWYRARPTTVRYLVWIDGSQFEASNADIPNP